jgi:ribonuclease R
MTDDTIERLLALLNRPDNKPKTPKALAHALEVAADDYQAFRDAVKGLIRQGKLVRAKDRTISAAGISAKEKDRGLIVGTFRRNAKGFGFVRPVQATVRHQDIYIAPDDTSDASSGDEVAVKIVKRSHVPGKGPAGKIVRIISRAAGEFVGTYLEDDGAGFVRIDGTTFHTPLYVGDPGAKGAKPGDKVALEIVRYPSPAQEGEGVITDVLGPRGQPGVDTLSVIRAFGLPDAFDDDVLDDARHQARLFDEQQIGSRDDFRNTLTVTIDPATARDFDDAISLHRDDRGHWQLAVHIADVSHFVPPGSALDRSARKRGTSVYLPDRVLPMLPEIISNSLASLQQGHVRYCMSAILDLSPEGIVTGSRFARSAIRVDRRFSYEEAFDVMSHPEAPHDNVTPEVRDLLLRMLDLARILRKRRIQRGALELVMPKVEVELGDAGQVTGAHLASDDESHQVIEEFMLAANEAVARFLTERNVGFLRRVHPEPEPSKLRLFAEFAASLGHPIKDPQSRFELQKILKSTLDAPERHAVHYGLLRSLKQATYTPEAEGHYALASTHYCHFTSPIRRYPDLQVHRQLAAILAGKTPKSDPDELVMLGQHCTRMERRADAAERELVKLKLLTHLEGRIGETFHAIIIGVEVFGLFAQLVELPIEGLVHVSALADDYYYLEAETHTLIGRRSGRRFRLGDPIEVRIAHVDVDRRELDLILAENELEPEPEADDSASDVERQHLPPSKTAGRRPLASPSLRSVSPPAAARRFAGDRPKPPSSKPAGPRKSRSPKSHKKKRKR